MTGSRRTKALAELRHAVRNFLALPALVVGCFVALAALTSTLDAWDAAPLVDARDTLSRVLFPDSQATSSLLSVIAAGLITISSITFSLLLVALQQSAASLTHEVFDQFLRRKLNQVYFGFFVGLAIYALVVLATVTQDFNPVLGATVALVLAGIALLLLVILIYSTVQQMRPAVITDAIRRLTLDAQAHHLQLVAATRRSPQAFGERVSITVDDCGFVTDIELDALTAAAEAHDVEIEILVPVGGFRAYGEPIAHVAGAGRGAKQVESAVRNGIRLERVRELSVDPRYGIEQLVNIAWTAISTSKQNPAPGVHVNLALRDLVARLVGHETSEQSESRIVYADEIVRDLLSALESLAVVASESLQDQNFAETVRTMALAVERASAHQRAAVESSVLRLLAALGELVLTTDLDDALGDLESRLRAVGSVETAARVAAAHSELAQSVGTLASRATRVPTSS